MVYSSRTDQSSDKTVLASSWDRWELDSFGAVLNLGQCLAWMHRRPLSVETLWEDPSQGGSSAWKSSPLHLMHTLGVNVLSFPVPLVQSNLYEKIFFRPTTCFGLRWLLSRTPYGFSFLCFGTWTGLRRTNYTSLLLYSVKTTSNTRSGLTNQNSPV